MANPFSHNHWNQIRHGYNPQSQIQPQSTKPKIVNIPVHFVGSEIASNKQSPASAVPTEEARIAAAVAIQRAVRGFLVRKNASIVRRIALQVEEIERKVREEEDKIRLDAKKRIMVSETLMALLLRLDSVRGVRDLRKRVIRRVIGLQEAIDSIAAEDRPISTIGMAENQEGSRNEASEDSTVDDENITDQAVRLDEEITATIGSTERNGNSIDGAISMSGMEEDPEVLGIEVTEEGLIDHDNAVNQTLVGLVGETNEAKTELEMEISAEVESPERQNDLISLTENEECSVEVDEDSSIDHENETGVEIPVKSESPERGIETGEDEQMSLKAEEGASMEVESVPEVEAVMGEGRGMMEMLERMAVENEKLKGMVTQLCAASSEQCRLMKGLAERVEQLERVAHHRMDRRKKRRSAACSALSSAK